MTAHRPRRALLGAVVLSLLVAGPAAAVVDLAPVDEIEDLDVAEDELASAEAELSELLDRIDRVEAEVAAADARLARLQGQLAAVRADLAAAEAEVAAAERLVEEARAAVATASLELAAAEDRWDESRRQLEARVAATWIHGRADTADLLVGSILAAEDLHEVAVVQRTSARLLDRDAQLLDDAITAARAATEARTRTERRREQAEVRAADAYLVERRAEALVAEQRALVSQADATRASRRAALRSIEEDAAARAALVDQLASRVEELKASSLAPWIRDVVHLPYDGPAPGWAGSLPAAGRTYGGAIEAASGAAGLDGRLLAALAWTESSFRPDVVSPAGAIGLTQLMPGTARELGVDPTDPHENLAGGARYIRQQLAAFGRIDLALAAYNAGPGRVRQAGNQVPDIVETQLYVLRVLDRWERLR